jgi:hypothetical protein
MVLSLAFFFSFYCYSDPAHSQDIQTTPNLVQPQGWQGCLDQHPGWIWGGTVGGPCPVQRAGDGAILFSYGQSTLSQTRAVNQALSGTGIQIRGYEYSWTIKNANAGGNQAQPYDPLNINVSLYDSTNTQVLETRNYDYSYRINDWTTFRGTEEYQNRYSLAAVGNLTLSITSRDVGNWAGYYGPEINYVNLRLRYSVDICAASPLSSPECPGYTEAYRQQQCSANPLFDSSCPGYTEAYFQLQCGSNPLYNPACPGYQIAYFTQQCSANPLWNPECPGYQQAYFNQQCSLSPLYNNQCPGYQQAYFNQQCTANPLYDSACPGYQKAYFDQQCSLSPLYNNQCPGYQQAYFSQQCSLNTLYNSACPGYQQAYLTQQCSLNSLYSRECPGYAVAYFDQQCQLSPLYNTQCPGYQQAYFTQQCNLNQLWSTDCPGYQTAYLAQQCGLNPLFSTQCPTYQQAYFDQQCQLNSLYNSGCPGYSVAYQEKLQNDACRANPQNSPICAGYTAATADPVVATVTAPIATTTVVDPVATLTEVPLVADPIVNQTLNNNNTVNTVGNPTREATTSTPVGLGTGLRVPGLSIQPTTRSTTARQQALAAARAANTSAQGQVRDSQTQQQEAALATMATVPGFDSYQSAVIPDAQFYRPRDIYRGVTIQDNARAQRALNQRSDRLHQEMINEQYTR